MTGHTRSIHLRLAVLLATVALAGSSGPARAVPPDFDSSGFVDFDDFFILVDRFGMGEEYAGFDPAFDMDATGVVDYGDFFLLRDNYLLSDSEITIPDPPQPWPGPWANAGAVFSLTTPTEIGAGASQEFQLGFHATGLVDVGEIQLTLEWEPAGALEVSPLPSMTGQWNSDGFVTPGALLLSPGQLTVGSARIGGSWAVGLTGDHDLGFLVMRTSSSFSGCVPLTIRVTRIAIGPNLPHQDVFLAEDVLDLGVTVQPSPPCPQGSSGSYCGDVPVNTSCVETAVQSITCLGVDAEGYSQFAVNLAFTNSRDAGSIQMRSPDADVVPADPVALPGGASTRVFRLVTPAERTCVMLLGSVTVGQRFACEDTLGVELPSCAGSFLPGDVNFDGGLGFGDFLLVLQFAVGLVEPTPEQAAAADLDGDGEITSADAILLWQQASLKPTVRLEAVSVLRPSLSTGASSLLFTFEDLDPLAGGDLLIRYNAALGQVSGVQVEGWSAQCLSAINTRTPGEVRISFVEPDRQVASRRLSVRLLLPGVDPQTPVEAEARARFYGSGGGLVGEIQANPRSGSLPPRYALLQNYPNPFNPSTTIQYELPEPGYVVLQVFNLSGQLVRTLVESKQQAGHHRVAWDGRDEGGHRVGSGVYLYRLRVGGGGYTAVRRMVFLE